MNRSFVKWRLTLIVWSMALMAVGQVTEKKIVTGAEQLHDLIPLLHGKRVALMVNNTSMVGPAHLVDTLMKLSIRPVKIFAPEHGFRGMADAGEEVKDGIDAKTGLPVVSLYGNSKKPTAEQLDDVDLVIFDIQDVGVRFFTYISSLHYLMEACAEHGKSLIVLDRPNPNAGYIDGPIRRPELKSFVGMHPIPIVYGLTIGELAQMINGEHWLAGEVACTLKIIPLKNYTHDKPYALPVKPSPNLPNDHAIALYPSTCLFEGTAMSIGRGTLNPFELAGHPDLTTLPFTFTPVNLPGMAKHPPFENVLCHGIDMRGDVPEKKISFQRVRELYQLFPEKEKFFNAYFNTLTGTKELVLQIRAGLTDEQIHATWQDDLDQYKQKRKKYLLYP
jgi:uncharacterized protein YbbC (DUF1343 family)